MAMTCVRDKAADNAATLTVVTVLPFGYFTGDTAVPSPDPSDPIKSNWSTP